MAVPSNGFPAHAGDSEKRGITSATLAMLKVCGVTPDCYNRADLRGNTDMGYRLWAWVLFNLCARAQMLPMVC